MPYGSGSCGVVAAVISGVLVAWLSGLLNDDGPSNPPSPTSKRYILPFAENGNLQPKYRAARKVQTGECPTNSVFSADPEALRCVTAGELFDPCWSHALTVACLRSPWDPEVTVISKVTAHAPPSSEKPKPEPWALEIKTPKGGVTLRCSFMRRSNVHRGQPTSQLALPEGNRSPDRQRGGRAGSIHQALDDPL